MIKHGEAPYLECSSAGDKRFSAFFAMLPGEQSIETIYQAAKVFPDGRTGLHWKEAKGKTPVNLKEVQALYSQLWDEYIDAHPELHQVLLDAKGLSDQFGQPGRVCQATELWRIKNRLHRERVFELSRNWLPE